MKRGAFLVTVLPVLLIAAPVQVQEGSIGFLDAMPRIVGNERARTDLGEPWGAIGMTGACQELVLIDGILNAADHELDAGSFNIRRLTVLMPVGAVAMQHAREKRGQRVQLVLREPCPPEKLAR